MRRLAIVLAALLAACATTGTVGRTPAGRPIVRIPLQWSNVYLIEGEHPILVDTGSPGDLAALTAALRTRGVSLSEIALVVVTHGHADHAGLASAIARRSHARIALGAGDVPMARRGEDDELHPTSFFAALIRPVLPDHYHPFTPDIVVTDRVDLHEYGIAGHLEAMPGHTPGSIVLMLDNGTAFVGDQMLGGFFGGLIAPEVPGEHYFHADRQRNLGNIAQLLSRGVRVFYLGHGGPVRAADVARAFELPPPGR